MMICDNFQFVYYSDLSDFTFGKWYERIQHFLIPLKWEYPFFDSWFEELFLAPFCLKKDREILLCLCNDEIAGLAILKRTAEEQKICTLRVERKYQKMSIGKKLMERSFEWLENDKPLITVRGAKRHEFDRLFQYYDFRLEDKKWNYYRLFSAELAYNGELPAKGIGKEPLEIADMRWIIERFVENGTYDVERLIPEYVKHWKRVREEQRVPLFG